MVREKPVNRSDWPDGGPQLPAAMRR